MSYKITFDLPNSSRGQGVAVNGLGEFKNGSTYTIDDDQHDQFRMFNSMQVDEEDEHGKPTGRVVNKLGPTLLQANFQDGITVEKVVEEKPAEEKPKDEPKAKADEKSKGSEK